MPRVRTHYATLGLERDASSVDVAHAFRESIERLKADPGSSPESIAEVREAYQVLANPEARAYYDSTLPVPARARSGTAASVPSQATTGDEGFRLTPWKVGISIAVLAVALWAWKGRSKPPQPPIQIVQTTAVAPEPAESIALPEPVAAPQPSAPAPRAPPAGPAAMSAEELFAELAGSIARVQVMDASGQLFGQGSGVVIGVGTVLTNCHVVSKAALISVKVAGKVHEATVRVADHEFDLCSLSAPGVSAPAVALGGAADVRVGQRVYAIGAPQGLELTLSEGLVSSLRDVPGGALIQTTAPISPGSSGGGLFNAQGRLVGIVTFQHRYGQNLNFAVPAAWVMEMRNRSSSSYVGETVARDSNSRQ